jgi:hypothetical protein
MYTYYGFIEADNWTQKNVSILLDNLTEATVPNYLEKFA